MMKARRGSVGMHEKRTGSPVLFLWHESFVTPVPVQFLKLSELNAIVGF